MTLSNLISESEEQIKWLDKQIDGLTIKSDLQHRFSAGCFDISMEHQKSIVLLVANKLYGSAFSLLRLQVEAYVRGVWLHQCASEKEINEISKDNFPHFKVLLDAIEKLEVHEDKTLSKMKEASWKSLNSYTHSGYLQIDLLPENWTITGWNFLIMFP